MNEERQEGDRGDQQIGREVKHGSHWEGRKLKLRKPISWYVKASLDKKQTLPWTTFVLMSFHRMMRIKLLHITSLPSTDTSHQTLSVLSGRVDGSTHLGVTVTSRQTFLGPKQCLSQPARVCIFFPLPMGQLVFTKACVFPYSLRFCLFSVKN